MTPSTSTTNVVCGLSFSRSQPDFKGFLRVLRFPPSSKLTPSLIHLAVVLCFEVIYGSCLGAERLAGCTVSSVRPRLAVPFAIQSTDCEKGWLAGQTFYILLLLLIKVIGPEMPQKEEVQSSIHLHTRFGLLDLSKYQRLIWTKIFLQTFGT